MARPLGLSRRAFLASGVAFGGALAFARGVRAQEAAVAPLRIGAVLPIAGDAIPKNSVNLRAVGEAARMGLILGAEDGALNAAMLGWSPEVILANAPTAEAVERAARRMVARDGVTVLVGGYTEDEARVLSAVAQESGALYLNIGATSDALRGGCDANTFHVEASAAMYLDALLGWYVRAGFRRWHFVHDGTPEGQARSDRATAALADRHWAAEVTGEAIVAPGDTAAIAPALAGIAEAKPDVVLLLVDWRAQLDLLASAAAAGLRVPMTGFPEPATQLRDFYYTASRASPRQGAGYRGALWEATLDAYGARELNARFAARWGAPMDPPAWTAYQAVKIAYEAAIATGSRAGGDLAAHLAGEAAVFDVSKGIGVTFRPWDHQMRQSLYLVKIAENPSDSMDLAAVLARASLVGELPAIYMPGTDPIERLDQLGDIDTGKTCR
jgi:ABC-type branched-subunit amino acid transport system substrate-binding protein